MICQKHNIEMIEMGDESGYIYYCPDCNLEHEAEVTAQNEPDEFDQYEQFDPNLTGKASDDELIDRILVLLGVDPVDWATSLSGIYAAVRSNMQIGEPHMSKIEDWTDADGISEDTLTAVMFELVDRAKKAELEPDYLRDQLQECADVLNVFAQFANIKAHEHEHVTISVSIDTLREAKRLLGGAFRDLTLGADIPV